MSNWKYSGYVTQPDADCDSANVDWSTGGGQISSFRCINWFTTCERHIHSFIPPQITLKCPMYNTHPIVYGTE